MERTPAPALAGLVWSVWVQSVDGAVDQRHVPHGGAEVRCVLGETPQLVGPLTRATHLPIPAGGTVVGVRLRPGVTGAVAEVAAYELLDQRTIAAELWGDTARLTDLLGDAPSPSVALAHLQSFLWGVAGPRDLMVQEAARRLLPWGSGTATLPEALSVSERQLRRRFRSQIGVGPKTLQRLLRFQAFIARVQASIDRPDTTPVDLTRWAVDAGYHDLPHLGHESRRLMGVTPRQVLDQYRAACAEGHDHTASYLPMLRGQDGRFVQDPSPGSGRGSRSCRRLDHPAASNAH